MSLVETLEEISRVDFQSSAAAPVRARVLGELGPVVEKANWSVSWLGANKVAPTAYHSLLSLGSAKTGPLLDLLMETQGPALAVKRRRALLRAELRNIAQPLADLHIMLVKGASLWYLIADIGYRSQSDIDLVVPDSQTAWAVVGRLSRMGYRIGRAAPWLEIRRSPRDLKPTFVGSVILEKRLAASHGVRVDIHWPSLPVGAHNGYLVPEWFWKGSRRTEHGFRIPSPENALLAVLAHAHHHGYVTLKDINDVYLILASYERDMDWSYIGEHIRLLGMLPLFSFVLQKVARIYNVTSGCALRGGFHGWLSRAILNWQYAKYRHASIEMGINPVWTLGYVASRFGLRQAIGESLRDAWAFVKAYLQERTKSNLWLYLWFRMERRRPYVTPFCQCAPVFLVPVNLDDQQAGAYDLNELCRRAHIKGIQVYPVLSEGFVGIARDRVELLVSPENIYLVGASFIVTDEYLERARALASDTRSLLQGSGGRHLDTLSKGGETGGGQNTDSR
ncbi:MAG: nucleotidyltransferase family protein [Bacteroidota bacterium]